MEREERSDRFTEVEGRFAGYEVYDQNGEKIGTVDDLFIDEDENYEYVGVKTGLLGTKSTLIPWQMIELDDTQMRMVVSADKDMVKDAPAFDDDEEITPELEDQVHRHFVVERATIEERGPYAAYFPDSAEIGPTTGQASAEDTPSTGRAGVADEDELRVQRTDEELHAGTRERQAGTVNVRKRVRTDRERMEVPTRREEIHVDRVPVEGEAAAEADIGDQEIRVPVTEEEPVVEKRPVAKEEIRIRKDVVEDTETIEEDVRREEVDVDDHTERGTR